MKRSILVMASILLMFHDHGTAQSKDALVGTWKLISATNLSETGEVMTKDALGHSPTGFLTYTPDGRMTVITAYDGRKPFSALPASVEERAQAYATFIAYAGTYTVSGDRVIHHVQVAHRQDWVNTDQVRVIVKLEANRLTLRTSRIVLPTKGSTITQEVVWERLKPDTARR
jgi:hypothetical protein